MADILGLRFNGYPKQSRIPAWLPLAVEQFSPENLRRFLIFCTEAPSLPPAGLLAGFEIGVQYQRCSEALPVAHTCFNKLDLPDYQGQALFGGEVHQGHPGVRHLRSGVNKGKGEVGAKEGKKAGYKQVSCSSLGPRKHR